MIDSGVQRVAQSALAMVAMLIVACGADPGSTGHEETGAESTGAVSNEAAIPAAPVRVYTTGNIAAAREILGAYRAETSNRFQLVSQDSAASAHGAASGLPDADLYILDGLAALWTIAEADGFRPVFSDTVKQRIPAAMRDSESRWTGLSITAQFVTYNPALVSNDELAGLDGYAALGSETWRNRLCLSSSRSARNQSLVAFLIRHNGVRQAEILVRQWVANLAIIPFANDAGVLQAIAEGRCAIGIVASNAYFDFAAGTKSPTVRPHFFPDTGALSIDISGAGVSRHAGNPDAAAHLLEWLTSPAANALFAALDREVPASPQAEPGADAEWFAMYDHDQPLSDLGFLLEEAVKLVERAHYP